MRGFPSAARGFSCAVSSVMSRSVCSMAVENSYPSHLVCAKYNNLFHLIYAENDNRFNLVTSHDSIGRLKVLVAWISGIANAPKITNTFLLRL